MSHNGMRPRVLGPIRWFGGKGNFLSRLLPYAAVPHHTYVEVFGGGAALLFARRPAPVEVYNDIDQELVGFFRVLRDPCLGPELIRRLRLTPYARAEYIEARATWRNIDDRVERARCWYVIAQQSFGARFGAGWGISISDRQVGHWRSAIADLPRFADRLLDVQIECRDWRAILDTYDTPATLFYVDPPYVHATRRAGGYEHELTDDDHRELVDRIQGLAGMVLLSGYAHEIYSPLEAAGWSRDDYQIACHVAGRTRHTGIRGDGAALRLQPRTETVWCNPALQAALGQHDQLWLGL